MRRAHRLLRLVQLLRARRVATAAELAEELGVSTRTVYRAVRDLEDAGVPVEGEAGVGYRLAHRVDLPPMTFSPLELEALVLGARMVSTWADPELAAAANSAVQRVQGAMPGPLARTMDESVLFSRPTNWSKTAGKNLSLLRSAIAEQRKVVVDYADAMGVPTQRTLRPLGLYFWGTRWTLAAWCELRHAFRNFRPDRIVAVSLLDARFDPTDECGLEAFRTAMAEEDGHPM